MIIIVDVQNDFCEGGKLAVSGGKQVSKNIQDFIEHNYVVDEEILLTQDWHPANHCSFKEFGGEWPEHCIGNTAGAAIEESLVKYLSFGNYAYNLQIKGWATDKDMYSFLDHPKVKELYRPIFENEDRIVVTGIVGTVCVQNTIKDIIEMGFGDKVIVPIDCVAHFSPSTREALIEWLNENDIDVR